jgi:ArsR family transcriptional regulator, arsenate/arsenite/antimonite-responsive transcriptional repressor
MYAMHDLAIFFAALADPTRLRLLHLMKEGEICVCFLQGVLQTNQPKISRHLAYLKKAGLVEARRDGKWMHYHLAKQDKEFERILLETLKRLEKEPEIQDDIKRLKKICCTPSKFGFSSPPERNACK